MSASIDRFMVARRGGATLPSSVWTGPEPSVELSFSQHCRMIFTDWRISSIRIA